MYSEFYKKTKDLFEEYQKRELHYLNTERILNSKFDVSNEFNMPIEEYLQKLNKRKKEGEETYQGLMHHFEELDRRTDNLSEKLEKLSSLKMSMSSLTPWSELNKSYGHFIENTPSNTMQSTSILRNTSLQTFQSIPFTASTKIASTQTDQFFCRNCQFPISFSSASNIIAPSISLPSESITKPMHNIDLTSLLNENPIVTPHMEDLASNFNRINEEEILKNKTLAFENQVPKSDAVADLKSNVYRDLPSYDENLDQTSTKTSHMYETKPMIAGNNESMDMKVQFSEDAPSISDSVEKIVSKSDDESLNHEFDFLDSDKKSKNVPSNDEKISQISDVKETINVISDTIVTVDNIESNVQITDEAALNNDSTLTIPDATSKNSLDVNVRNIDDDKDKISESSISIGGAHSPSIHSDNVSAVSDSDSFYEKENSPLKASAAYQALLGNVSANKRISKDVVYSESDTEDEVERVLANATRKSSTVPVTLLEQGEKSDDPKKISENKPKAEPRKSISLSKSQQLSKSTRKVLGLDTSSGSEGEVKVPAKTNTKIEEDSDEFDFYD